MKVKKQTKEEINVNINKKKAKKGISKVEVTNGDGGNVIKKIKQKEIIVNGKKSIDRKKNKNKLNKIVETAHVVESVKNAKKGNKLTESILLKPVTSVKDVTKGKKKEKKIFLKPDMTSSELLRTLDSTIFAKKNNDNQEESKKRNSKKPEAIGEVLVKSKKIIEISDSNEVNEKKKKKPKQTDEQPKKLKKELKILESKITEQNGTQEISETKTKKLEKKLKSNEVKKTSLPLVEKKKITQNGIGIISDVKNKQLNKPADKQKKLEKLANKDSQKLEPLNKETEEIIQKADSGGKKKKINKQNNKLIKPKIKSEEKKKENDADDKTKIKSEEKKKENDADDKTKIKSEEKKKKNIADNTSVKKQKFGKPDKVKKVEKKKQKVLVMNQRLVPSLRDASKFDERTFSDILNVNNIEKTVETLTKLVKKETDSMKNTIFKDYRYVLNLALFKIPSAPKRIVKLKVKHSIVASDDDVLFIVKDLKRGARLDYEPTKHHYEDLISDRGIEGIKTVMPFNQLKKEYSSYEMKRKLSNLYDHFICDGSIAGHVFAFLGKIFACKSRGILYSVRVDGKDLKKEIKKALNKTGFRQGAKGDIISIIVGNHTQTAKQIAENCVEVVEQLKTLLPGGHPNIRNVTIKCNLKGTSSLPLYLSMGQPPKDTPYIIGAKEQKLNKLKERAEEILAKFSITNTGSIEKITPEEIQERKRKRDELKSKIEAKKMKINAKNEGAEVKSKNKKKEKKNKKKEIEPEPEPELIKLDQDDSKSEDGSDFELNSDAENIDESDDAEDNDEDGQDEDSD